MIDDNLIYGFQGRWRFLSNFYPVSHGIAFAGILYPTTEHAYQAGKTFDKAERALIALALSPGEAKSLGEDVTMRHDWKETRLLHMEGVNRNKFRAGTQLAQMLIATGDAKLVEANTWGDTFWGRCRGKGQNNLGLILMEIRDDLQQQYGTGKIRK